MQRETHSIIHFVVVVVGVHHISPATILMLVLEGEGT
jgi:hypothetical protein